MFEAAIWWLVVEILALAALPVTTHLFRNLQDKGYGFAKPLGIMLPAYIFWLLSSLGILDNTRATAAFVAIVIGVVAWAALGQGRREAVKLWREQPGLVILIEVLFALAFGAWCLIRSYNPEIAATEKPMEIAFLNGILRSGQFPPVDPWLSGYSISYYYFGYVMVAMLAKLSGIQSSIAFNLAIALLFALTVLGAFGIAFNLASGRSRTLREEELAEQDGHLDAAEVGEGITNSARALHIADENRKTTIGPIACGFLGALFVAIMGNLEGLLELFYSHAALPQSFWTWLNIQGLDKPYLSPKWYPTEWFWWFKASRIIADFDPITKVSRDYTINEFPSFSFLLGDLHPHVLALPFTFVAMGLALCMLKSDERITWRSILQHRPLEFVLWGIVFGGLGFINSWDMPTYLALLVLAFAIKKRFDGEDWLKESVLFGLAMLGISLVLYVPFYIGFSSQVKGLGIVTQRTKLHQFLIFWGPFLFFVVAYLVAMVARARAARTSKLLASPVQDTGELLIQPSVGWSTTDTVAVLFVVVLAVALVALQAAVLAVLLPVVIISYELLFRNERGLHDKETRFVTLLVLLGAVLLSVCELLFVRDFFGNRMNTVFKVYYQVWQMLAVSSAYVVYWFLSRNWSSSIGRTFKIASVAALGIAILLAMGSFIYPVAATITKTNGLSGKPTLDGSAFMAASQRGDYDAIAWLNQNVKGTPVILEAAGASYSQFGRISAFTGLPTVIGWDGHELQWRGTGEEATKRKAAVETIYQTPDEQLARSLLKKYNVTYVYVGNLEREAYGKAGALDKFARFGDAVYQNAGVTIYKIRSDQ